MLKSSTQQDIQALRARTAGRSADFSIIGDGERYALQVRSVPIAFEAERIRDKWGDLHAQITVHCGLGGTRGHRGILTVSTEDLSQASARQRFGKTLETLSCAPQIDWVRLYDGFALRIFEVQADGHPSVLLTDVPSRADDGYFDVLGVKLTRTGTSGIYAKGDSAKSLFGLYALGELAKQGVPVTFIDFEWDGFIHMQRAAQLWPDGDQPPIRYIQCTRPLIHEAEGLRRDCLAHGTRYLVIDSIAPACHEKPEAAETAIAFNRAARYIAGSQAGQLWLGHIVKSRENVPDGEETFFGSVFWNNFIRCGWYVKAQPSSEGGPLVCAYHHRKRNGLGQLASVGLAIHFEPERIRFERCDPAELSSDLAVGLPLWQRMLDALRQGPRSIPDLAEDLNAKPDAIKKAAQRGSKLFTKIEGAHGVPPRLALVERRNA
jgi:hypothetical protein